MVEGIQSNNHKAPTRKAGKIKPQNFTGSKLSYKDHFSSNRAPSIGWDQVVGQAVSFLSTAYKKAINYGKEIMSYFGLDFDIQETEDKKSMVVTDKKSGVKKNFEIKKGKNGQVIEVKVDGRTIKGKMAQLVLQLFDIGKALKVKTLPKQKVEKLAERFKQTVTQIDQEVENNSEDANVITGAIVSQKPARTVTKALMFHAVRTKSKKTVVIVVQTVDTRKGTLKKIHQSGVLKENPDLKQAFESEKKDLVKEIADLTQMIKTECSGFLDQKTVNQSINILNSAVSELNALEKTGEYRDKTAAKDSGLNIPYNSLLSIFQSIQKNLEARKKIIESINNTFNQISDNQAVIEKRMLKIQEIKKQLTKIMDRISELLSRLKSTALSPEAKKSIIGQLAEIIVKLNGFAEELNTSADFGDLGDLKGELVRNIETIIEIINKEIKSAENDINIQEQKELNPAQ